MAEKKESLTNSFNRFNILINDLRNFSITKDNDMFVHKFPDSLDENYEHHVDILMRIMCGSPFVSR